jgi:hypothetical protein
MKEDAMIGAAWTATGTGSVWRLRARSWWSWIARVSRSRPRRLRLAETLPLGDRRFVAVVEFDGSRFLLGGTASSLVLLARLTDKDNEILPPTAADLSIPSTEAGRS